MFIAGNQIIIEWMGLFLHRVSMCKAMTQNGYNVVRLQKQQSVIIGLIPFVWLLLIFLYNG